MPSKLIDLDIPRPGVFGVNTAASGDIMPKEYCVQATNLVFSDEGYPEARRGSTRQHANTLQVDLSAGSSQTVRNIYYTRDENAASLIIGATQNKIFKISGATVTDITGTMTAFTTGNWKFVNLNDKVIAFQPGEVMAELTTPSSGSFADITFSGTEAPAGSGATSAIDILAAAGRLWVLDGDQLRYSDLLDHTSFDPSGGDGGAFDLNAVRLNGEDKPVALTEFNGNILVFFERHIVVYGGIWNPNNDASTINPTPGMAMIENIKGVGCVARDSIQHTQNDVLFLSEQGVTSLSRVVQEKSMPLKRYSDNVRREVNQLVQKADLTGVWSVYLEGKGVYLIGAPDYTYTILIDVATRLPDETYRCGLWNKAFNNICATPVDDLSTSEDLWASLYVSDEAQYISKMKGYKDYLTSAGGSGSTYNITYESSWTAIIEDLRDRVKIPKKLGFTVKGSGAQTFTLNMAFDYGSFIDSRAKTAVVTLAAESKYGTATYGGSTTSSTTGYYGTASGIVETKVPGFSSGRIIKIRVTTTVDGSPVSLQRISIKSKIGRQQ